MTVYKKGVIAVNDYVSFVIMKVLPSVILYRKLKNLIWACLRNLLSLVPTHSTLFYFFWHFHAQKTLNFACCLGEIDLRIAQNLPKYAHFYSYRIYALLMHNVAASAANTIANPI